MCSLHSGGNSWRSGNVFITLKREELEVWECVYYTQVGIVGGLGMC